jgi:hypothetical protein
MDRDLQVFANVLNVQFFPFSEATPTLVKLSRTNALVGGNFFQKLLPYFEPRLRFLAPEQGRKTKKHPLFRECLSFSYLIV